MNLYDCFCEDVDIVDVDGTKWIGHVTAYTPAIDSETGEEEIAVQTNSGVIGFCASEIKSIRIK